METELQELLEELLNKSVLSNLRDSNLKELRIYEDKRQHESDSKRSNTLRDKELPSS